MADFLDEKLEEVIRLGPTRVVINEAGEATSYRLALRDYQTNYAVVFIRDDGWTLGAPAHLEAVAEKIWEDKWVGVIRRRANAEPFVMVYGATPSVAPKEEDDAEPCEESPDCW
jgi:hypothetical protein